MSDILVIGSVTEPVEVLRSGLDAELVEVPTLAADHESTKEMPTWPWSATLDAWRTSAAAGRAHRQIVVAPWADLLSKPVPLVDLADEDWFARLELPFARWYAAMGVAARRCADGGTIVAVIERPPPLDCAERAAETGLADAIESMVRSVARAEGARDVRVNAVTTPVRLAPERVVAPAPSLSRYPGTMETDVVGAVRMLLHDGAVGVTGSIVDADDGRSWR